MSSIRSAKLTDEMQAEGGAAELKRNELSAGEVQRLETGNKPIEAAAIAHKNLSIQCLRGLAALFVAFSHAWGFSRAHFGDSGWVMAFDRRFGYIGVAVFFAISG